MMIAFLPRRSNWGFGVANRGRDRRRSCPAPGRRAIRPGPEPLEDRRLLSTLTVLNGLDSGPGSLRQAVLDANAAPGADTIVFARNVHKVTLTSGELAITDDLNLNGPGANRLSLSGNDSSRVLDVHAGASVAVSGLTVTVGRADGGDGKGGGLYGDGSSSLALTTNLITRNRARGGPGKGGGRAGRGLGDNIF